ncbi:MAG: hypothetical protein JSW73_05340 [Candidatus Woesearchaeota archaeon]|nr:MAG: hypothetical protein JSW73_05340 [Candidatus Woesearchaeota archaeon]
MCLQGDRSEKIKKQCKICSVNNKKEANGCINNVEDKEDEEELFSVPEGHFKIFPRSYYKCVETDDGDLVCFK